MITCFFPHTQYDFIECLQFHCINDRLFQRVADCNPDPAESVIER